MKFLLILLSTALAVNACAQGVKVGDTPGSPHSSAMLDVESTNRGFLPPRMSTSERDNIVSPAEGLEIFNTTSHCKEIFINGFWQSMFCGCSGPPAAPAQDAEIPAITEIIWSWQPVVGSTGYKYNSVNNYATATDAFTATQFTQTGLTGQTTYSLFVWAYNNCGPSAMPLELEATTLFPCGDILTINHIAGNVAPVTKTVNYGTVSTAITGATKCWITQNLGATNQASAVNDNTEASGGWYWQFNRKQGYMHDGSSRTPNISWPSVSENSEWTSENDPCTIDLGSGWRLPTKTEWETADGAPQNWINSNGPFSSVLKIHPAGYLIFDSGVLGDRGTNGDYWSSTQANTSQGWDLAANGGGSLVDPHFKSYGFSVRCLKD